MIYIKSENDSNYDHAFQAVYASQKKAIRNCNPQKLKEDFISCLKKSWPDGNFDWKVEDSTKVITVRKITKGTSETSASFDIAIIDKSDGNHKILVNDKTSNPSNYTWNEIVDSEDASTKANDWKGEDLIGLKKAYLLLKHNQKNIAKDDNNYKASAALFVEAVNNYDNYKKIKLNNG